MYLFYVPGRGFNSPHLQNAFYNFNKTGIEPREASAEQVRGRTHKSEQCRGFVSALYKRKTLQMFFNSRLFYGTDAAGSERRRLEGAYRMYATESGSIPPISKTRFMLIL